MSLHCFKPFHLECFSESFLWGNHFCFFFLKVIYHLVYKPIFTCICHKDSTLFQNILKGTCGICMCKRGVVGFHILGNCKIPLPFLSYTEPTEVFLPCVTRNSSLCVFHTKLVVGLKTVNKRKRSLQFSNFCC